MVVGDFASSSSSSSSHVDNNNNNKTNNNSIITSGYIDLPLQRDHENFPFMRVATPASEVAAAQVIHDLQQAGYQKLLRKNPKPSQTQFQVVARYNMIVNSIHNEDDNGNDEDDNDDDDETNRSLRLIPITGRTHQLRVHCAAAGYSILGDPTYSLHGEASPQGGLSTIRTKTAVMTPPIAGGEHQQQQQQQAQDHDEKCMVGEEKANYKDRVIISVEATSQLSSPSLSSCPLEMQKAWTKFYPPNNDNCPMCLHASKLSFPHPITNTRIQVHVPAPFEHKDYFRNRAMMSK